jgi:alpha-tubulin suppressor-like RCC1 family protein
MFLPNLRSLVLRIILPIISGPTPPGPTGPTASTFLFVNGRQITSNHGLNENIGTLSSDNPRQVGANNWAVLAKGVNVSSSGFMVAIRSGGSLWSWGAGTIGQTGLSTILTRSSPSQIGSFTDWSKISAGTYTCAGVRTNGTLWAWGRNNFGQLGQGNVTIRSSPVQIGSDTNWSDVLVGEYHCIALKTDGTLWTWGNNSSGQLGLGVAGTGQSVPVQIGTGTNWSKIAIGSRSSGAITNTGQLWVWGFNGYGMLGLGDTVNRSSPVQVGALTDWNSLSFGSTNYGSRHAAATKTNGTLWTWGTNNYGQLGQNNTTNRSSPVQVGTDTSWSLAEVFRYGFLAIKTGTLWFSGRNTYGQLGYRISIRGSNLSPIQVGTATGWTSSPGKLTTAYGCHAIGNTGGLWAWGNNTSGQLGFNDTTNRSLPTLVSGVTSWNAVSHYYQAGVRRALGGRTDGTLWAWGSNASGQLGLGNVTQRNSPVQIGTGTGWGITGGQFSAAPDFSIAVKTDGTLWAWGLGSYGMLGLGDTVSRSSPVQVGALTDWSKVSCARRHTLALKTNGTLWAWGLNSNGQLGQNNVTNTSSPVQIGTATDWAFIFAGYSTSHAIKTNGTLWAWGNASSSRLGFGGYGNYTSPRQVGSLTDWSKVYSSTGHTVAIKTNGTLWVWGFATYGRLGLNDGVNRISPVQIGSETNWGVAKPGAAHTVAIKTNGTLWAWGLHSGGRCAFAGTANYAANISSPVQVGSLNTWSNVSPRFTDTVFGLKT